MPYTKSIYQKSLGDKRTGGYTMDILIFLIKRIGVMILNALALMIIGTVIYYIAMFLHMIGIL